MAFTESFSAVQNHVLSETLRDFIFVELYGKRSVSLLVMAPKPTVALFCKEGHIPFRMKIKHGNLYCI